MIRPDQVNDRYRNLLHMLQRKKNKTVIGLVLLFSSVLVFTSLSSIMIFLGIPLNTTPAENPLSLVPIILVISMMIGGLALFTIGGKQIFDKHQKMFFEFYHTYVVLKEFLDVKGKREKRRAIKRINDLSYYVESWTDGRAPTIISKLPESIDEKLQGKIYPLIKQSKIDELSNFVQVIYELSYAVYEKELTESQLFKLESVLSNIQPTPESRIAKITDPLRKQQFGKIFAVSLIPTIILIIILSFSELGWGQTALGAIGVGLVIFFGLYRRK